MQLSQLLARDSLRKDAETMRLLKITALMFFAAALVMPAAFTRVMQRQSLPTRPESFQSRLERFQHTEVVEDEDSPAGESV